MILRPENFTVRQIQARASSVGGDSQRNDVIGLLGRHDAKPFFRFFLGGEFAVVPEDHLRTVASFERSFRGVLGDGEAVTAKGMTQAVALPFELGFDAGDGAGLIHGGGKVVINALVARTDDDVAFILGARLQPSNGGVRQRHEATLRGLGVVGGDFNKPALEIHVAPVEPENFRAAQAAEPAKNQPRNQRVRRRGEQFAQFGGRENERGAGRDFGAFDGGKFVEQVTRSIFAAHGEMQQGADMAEFVELGAVAGGQAVEPHLQHLAGDMGDWN